MIDREKPHMVPSMITPDILREMTKKIVTLGEAHRALSAKIQSNRLCSKENVEQLVARHDALIDKKVALINEYYRVTGQSLRVHSFN